MSKSHRFYAEYLRGWRVYDHMLTFGAGDPMPVCQCWTRDDAFNIRDLLNEQEDAKRHTRQTTP